MSVLSNADIDNNNGVLILNKCDTNFSGAGYDLTIEFICDSDSGKIPEIKKKDEHLLNKENQKKN